MTAPTTFFEDDVVRAASWHGVVFEMWWSVSTARQFRELCPLEVAAAMARPGRKLAMITVVEIHGFPGMDAEARRELDARTKRIAAHLSASVIVVPTQGFAASIVRGVLTSQALFTGARTPSHVTPSVDEACAWLAPKLPSLDGRPVSALEIRRAYDAVAVRRTS